MLYAAHLTGTDPALPWESLVIPRFLGGTAIYNHHHVRVVVTAGGRGTRLGGETAKQFLPLAGVPLVERCLTLFHDHAAVDDLVLTLPEAEIEERSPALRARFPKLVAVIAGGRERQDSVAAALDLPLADDALIAIHDAARPLFNPTDLDLLLETADRDGGGAPALPLTDTIVEVDDRDRLRAYPDRRYLRAVQTPQIFHFGILRDAHEQARTGDETYSDDTQVAAAAGHTVTLLPGRATNLKITTRDDLALAEALLARRSEAT